MKFLYYGVRCHSRAESFNARFGSEGEMVAGLAELSQKYDIERVYKIYETTEDLSPGELARLIGSVARNTK